MLSENLSLIRVKVKYRQHKISTNALILPLLCLLLFPRLLDLHCCCSHRSMCCEQSWKRRTSLLLTIAHFKFRLLSPCHRWHLCENREVTETFVTTRVCISQGSPEKENQDGQVTVHDGIGDRAQNVWCVCPLCLLGHTSHQVGQKSPPLQWLSLSSWP